MYKAVDAFYEAVGKHGTANYPMVSELRQHTVEAAFLIIPDERTQVTTRGRTVVRVFVTFLIMIGLGGTAWAESKCDRPDSNFNVFLSRFKNDASFRESRLITPLQYSLTDPEKTTKEQLSLDQIRARRMQIICGNACAASRKGTERQLCEEKPTVKGNSAEFVQYSCGTDVFGNSFHFVRKNGCWFLRGLDSSGG